jgi:hemerythrin-like domain-containing protein
MLAALLLMFGSVAANVATAQLISRMKHHISHVAHIKQEAMGRLKLAQSQKAIAEQNKISLTTKKTKIAKRLGRLKKEMSTLQQDDQARKQRTGMRKVE